MNDEQKQKEEQGTDNEERVMNNKQKMEEKHGLFKHHCKKCEIQ